MTRQVQNSGTIPALDVEFQGHVTNFMGRFQTDRNVRAMPGKSSVLPAMGLGLAPMPGGGHHRTHHRTFAICRLSDLALVRFANVPRASSRCADQRHHELQGVQKV
jgi:hypothetical protein